MRSFFARTPSHHGVVIVVGIGTVHSVKCTVMMQWFRVFTLQSVGFDHIDLGVVLIDSGLVPRGTVPMTHIIHSFGRLFIEEIILQSNVGNGRKVGAVQYQFVARCLSIVS